MQLTKARRRWTMTVLLLSLVLLFGLAVPGPTVLGAAPITLSVNGQTVPCDVPPQNVNGRVLVPIRAVSEALGCNVSYDPGGPTVAVTTSGSPGAATGGSGLAVIDATATYQAASPSVVAVLNYSRVNGEDTINGFGSGFVYSSDGLILTNAHVVSGASHLKVIFPNGKAYDVAAEILADTLSDIAVLNLHVSGLTPLSLADSDLVRPGQPVVAIGNPAQMQLRNSVTAGIVSGVGRGMEQDWYPVIQTDAAINPGNSGGPLLNVDGQVIGIINAKMVDEQLEGLGFAVPSNTVKDIVGQLLDKGRVSRPWLGVKLESSLEAQYGLPTDKGLVVVSVELNSPARLAGMKSGDEITAVDGLPVHSLWDFTQVLLGHEVGDTIRITVSRDGGTIELTMLLQDRPSDLD